MNLKGACLAAVLVAVLPFAAQAAEWEHVTVSEPTITAWVIDDEANVRCAALVRDVTEGHSADVGLWLFHTPRGGGGSVFAEHVDGVWQFVNTTDARGARRVLDCMPHFNDMRLYDLVRRDAGNTKAAALLAALDHLKKWLNASAK